MPASAWPPLSEPLSRPGPRTETCPGRAPPLCTLAEEVPVALVFNNTTHAVMMATPAELDDFMTGFAITEGLCAAPPQVEVRHYSAGAECRLWLSDQAAAALLSRRRTQMGPTGCGMCGVISVEQALREIAPVAPGGLQLSAADILGAEAELRRQQPLHDDTHAVHAAGWLQPGRGIVCVREDVGRHNALDKLAGALYRAGTDPAGGAVVLTSRVSVDMAQKVAALGAPAVIAMAAPTALAVARAQSLNLTLITNARRGRFQVHTHPERIL